MTDRAHLSPARRSRRPALRWPMDVAAGKANWAQGRTIMHLEVGEPGAPPPRPVREAAIAALLRTGRSAIPDALGRASSETHHRHWQRPRVDVAPGGSS